MPLFKMKIIEKIIILITISYILLRFTIIKGYPYLWISWIFDLIFGVSIFLIMKKFKLGIFKEKKIKK